MQNSLASLRHAYAQMVNGAVKDTAQAKRLAEGLIAPAIERLERASCADLAAAQAEIAKLRGALEVLETDAHFIFNSPPGETSQDVRDVIEWFAGSIRVALEQAK